MGGDSEYASVPVLKIFNRFSRLQFVFFEVLATDTDSAISSLGFLKFIV